ncbi:unnamed protein product [Nyctereutes procyonoides]|uniref:(raccoon dog) hypothetical protein n=1 Tax=Nyctereutes procyonoides TaxID=34880 RepID=A0A811XWM3_NYCPR|nr:unnamed protein product [Nyctereutes procyonoides]
MLGAPLGGWFAAAGLAAAGFAATGLGAAGFAAAGLGATGLAAAGLTAAGFATAGLGAAGVSPSTDQHRAVVLQHVSQPVDPLCPQLSPSFFSFI